MVIIILPIPKDLATNPAKHIHYKKQKHFKQSLKWGKGARIKTIIATDRFYYKKQSSIANQALLINNQLNKPHHLTIAYEQPIIYLFYK